MIKCAAILGIGYASLRVLFIGLVLISLEKPGSRDGASAGKRRNWYPGSCKPYTLHISHCSSIRTLPHTFLLVSAVVSAVIRNEKQEFFFIFFKLYFNTKCVMLKRCPQSVRYKDSFFFQWILIMLKSYIFVYRRLDHRPYLGLRYICHL